MFGSLFTGGAGRAVDDAILEQMRAERIRLQGENAALVAQVAGLAAQVDFLRARIADLQSIKRPTDAPVTIPDCVEIPLYWLMTREERHDRFTRNIFRPGYYTENQQIAMDFCRNKGTSTLVRGWKTPDGRIMLKDPTSVFLPVAIVLEHSSGELDKGSG